MKFYFFHELGGSGINVPELSSTPASPQTGNRKSYPKFGGWHEKDDAGNERQFVNSKLQPLHGARLSFVSVTTVRVGTASEDSVVADSTGLELMEFNGTLDAVVSGTGAGGLDTGSEAADTWYAVHIIGDTSGSNAPAAMLSLSATAPTLPGTHDIFRRVGWVRNNGSSDLIDFVQTGRGSWRAYMWANASSDRLVLTGGNATGSPPTPIDCSSLVPPTSTRIEAAVDQGGSPTVSFFLTTTGPTIAVLTKQQVIAGTIPVDSSQRLFYSNSSAAGSVDVGVRGFYEGL